MKSRACSIFFWISTVLFTVAILLLCSSVHAQSKAWIRWQKSVNPTLVWFQVGPHWQCAGNPCVIANGSKTFAGTNSFGWIDLPLGEIHAAYFVTNGSSVLHSDWFVFTNKPAIVRPSILVIDLYVDRYTNISLVYTRRTLLKMKPKLDGPSVILAMVPADQLSMVYSITNPVGMGYFFKEVQQTSNSPPLWKHYTNGMVRYGVRKI